MYSAWSVAQLKTELRRRGASLRGRKADLVNRLESYDRNFNFGLAHPPDDDDDPKMQLPAPESYHDVNSSMVLPPITKQHIRLYYIEFNKSPVDGLHLYESRYLVALRAAAVGEHTFIKSICKASMKRIQYEINIKLHSSGNIEESSCECVAGSGTNAHCKHVATVLFGVEHMVREKILIKFLVPTETLQKFHQPRNVFTSTPLKASQLPIKRKLENIIFSPCKMHVDDREYNEKVRSLIVNFPSTMPLKQLYEPANPHAIELDHDYTAEKVDVIFHQFNLTKITADEAMVIELETRGHSNNANWHKHRECRLTASKFHTICSLRPVNQSKFAKQLLHPSTFQSRATTHGLVNEKLALNLYRKDFSLNVTECGLFVSTERPYLGASPDGLVGDDTIIEIKCPYASRNKMIDTVSVPYIIMGDCGNLELKKGSPYYYQVQGQMYCTGRKFCNLIVYTFKNMEVIFIERDEEFLKHMLPLLDSFYQNHFKQAILNKYIYRDYLVTIKKKL